MSDELERRDDRSAAPAGGIEAGPEPAVSLAPELNRTLETVMDADSQRRMQEAAEAARQSVTIVNAPEAGPDERSATPRQRAARFRGDEIDEAGRGGGALGRAVARERGGRLLSLVVLVVVTAIAGLLILRWLRHPEAKNTAPGAPASARP